MQFAFAKTGICASRCRTQGLLAPAVCWSPLIALVWLLGCSKSPLSSGRDAGARDTAEQREVLQPEGEGGAADAIPTATETGPEEVTSSPAEVGKEVGTTDLVDAPSSDEPVSASVGDGPGLDIATCPYREATFVDSTGMRQWSWSFDWQTSNLAEICASYGLDSTIVVEISVPTVLYSGAYPECTGDEILHGGTRSCSVSGTLREEIRCTYGTLRFTAPSDKMGIAYYHIESREAPNTPRHRLFQDTLCPRSLRTSEPLAAAPPPVDGGTLTCPGYPSNYRVDADGGLWWWHHFEWKQEDLTSVCASYGPGAKMVLEPSVGEPAATNLPTCTNSEVLGGGTRACVMWGHWRFEADCGAGEMLVELPEQRSVGGFYHVESVQVPGAPRRAVGVDETCYRELRPETGPLLQAHVATPGYTSTGFLGFQTVGEPASNGQPCRNQSDCPRPSSQKCFIDAVLTACPDTAIGRCVPAWTGNCMLMPGCSCTTFFGSTCDSNALSSCGHLWSSDRGACSACRVPDAGV